MLTPEHHITVDCTATPLPTPQGENVLLELIQVDGFLDMAMHRHREDQYDANRDVLRGLAHEIRNPLGGLRGAAQLLERAQENEAVLLHVGHVLQFPNI